MSALNISSKEFSEKVLNSKNHVLVDFWAPWCVPCQMMAPILDELSNDEDLKGKLEIMKIDTEQEGNNALAYEFKIQSIPNLKLFFNGKIVKEFIGLQYKDDFKRKLLEVVA
jgi:thioredoxin 1